MDAWRGAFWAVRALREATHELKYERLETIRVRPPIRANQHGSAGVARVLRYSRASCLPRSLVRQAWMSALGDARAIVLGVSAPARGFAAHAWLEGDPEDLDDSYTVLRRLPYIGEPDGSEESAVTGADPANTG